MSANGSKLSTAAPGYAQVERRGEEEAVELGLPPAFQPTELINASGITKRNPQESEQHEMLIGLEKPALDQIGFGIDF